MGVERGLGVGQEGNEEHHNRALELGRRGGASVIQLAASQGEKLGLPHTPLGAWAERRQPGWSKKTICEELFPDKRKSVHCRISPRPDLESSAHLRPSTATLASSFPPSSHSSTHHAPFCGLAKDVATRRSTCAQCQCFFQVPLQYFVSPVLSASRPKSLQGRHARLYLRSQYETDSPSLRDLGGCLLHRSPRYL